MSSDVVLKIDDLSVQIMGSQILRSISFEITRGSIVGIIGPNGSGKTTLFNCLSGFHSSTAGMIVYCDKIIHQLTPHERARLGIARIFQNFGIFREMTVMDNMLVAMERKLSKLEMFLPFNSTTRKLRLEALEHLSKVGLAERANDRASSLSGGQMRLLEICRSLAFGADLFLLDEPTAGVAPRLKEHIAKFILDMQALGKTIMVIEHDINFIDSFCQRILVLNEGQIVMDDQPSAIYENPLIQEIYFGRKNAIAH